MATCLSCRLLVLLLFFGQIAGFRLAMQLSKPCCRKPQRIFARRSALRMSDEREGQSMKGVFVGAVVAVGIFGTGALGDVQKSLWQGPQAAQVQVKRSTGLEGERGAMTRLSRREINYKLAQIPVFYASSSIEESKIHLEDSGTGRLFVCVEDANAYAKTKKLAVKAATLEDVYYPLVTKKAKIGSFLPGVASSSDASANYVLEPPQAQTKVMTDADVKVAQNDVPLYRVPNLAFSKEAGLEVPLFVYREDAELSFERLKSEKRDKVPIEVVIQVTSLANIISKWEVGGFEGRALEIYPGTQDIDSARRLIGDSST